jgi:hypothetical protein
MKNVYCFLLAAFVFLGSSCTYNQLHKPVAALTYIPSDGERKLRPNEVKSNAIRTVFRLYRNASDIRWFKSIDGYMAYFFQDGYKHHCGFDLEGNWNYTMVSYPESKLDKSIRHHIKSKYYDFSIVKVDEIQLIKKIVYVISLEDDTSFLKVKITDDEMEVIEQFRKAKN